MSLLVALLGNEREAVLDDGCDACFSLCALGSQYRLLARRLETRLLQFANDPMEQSLLESIEVFIQAYFDVLCAAETKPCSTLELACKLSAHLTAMPEMLMLMEYVLGKQRRHVLPELERLALVTSRLTSEWLETVAIPSCSAVLASCTAVAAHWGDPPRMRGVLLYTRRWSRYHNKRVVVVGREVFAGCLALASQLGRVVGQAGAILRIRRQVSPPNATGGCQNGRGGRNVATLWHQQEFDSHSRFIRNAFSLARPMCFTTPSPFPLPWGDSGVPFA
ncbi:hypothetical protein BASA81_012383 [Batrachochytrium salamandrivorans]|nr:hypothetical protein BASA81_012383 [Batrachochytrium salamandrivorans]